MCTCVAPALCCSFSNHILSFDLARFIPLCPMLLSHFPFLPAPLLHRREGCHALPRATVNPGSSSHFRLGKGWGAEGKGLHHSWESALESQAQLLCQISFYLISSFHVSLQGHYHP